MEGGHLRYNRRTGQTKNVTPKPVRPADFRTLRTAPLVFSMADPRVMFFGSNKVWRTADGGESWKEISPDLTRKTFEVPPTIGKYRPADSAKATQRGVVYTIAPSYVDIKDRKSTRLNSSHSAKSRMPSSA